MPREDVPEVVRMMQAAEVQAAPPRDRLALELSREYYRQLSAVLGRRFAPAPLASMRRRKSWPAFLRAADRLIHRGWEAHVGNFVTAQFEAREHSRPGRGVFPNELAGPVAVQRFERFLRWGAVRFAGDSAAGFNATADEQLLDQLQRDHYQLTYLAEAVHGGDIRRAAEAEVHELRSFYLIALSWKWSGGTGWLAALPPVGSVVRALALFGGVRDDPVRWASVTEFVKGWE